MPKVTIGIPTFRRPRLLERALAAIEAQVCDCPISVLVAENDVVRREGQAVVERVSAAGFRFPLRCIPIASRGISYGRNALSMEALVSQNATLLVFVDDDQIPDPHWLQALIQMQKQTGAEVVSSAVIPMFETAPPEWLRQCAVFQRDTVTNGLSERIPGTGGVLLTASLLGRLDMPWFDPFYEEGGEDTDFFLRLQSRGVRFARSSAALIFETYPEDRAKAQWALARAFKGGRSYISILRRQRRAPWDLANEALKIPLALALAPLAVLCFVGRRTQQFNVVLKAATALGKASAFLSLAGGAVGRTPR